MAQLISDRRDIDFVLYEQLEAETLTHCAKYSAFNRKMFDMIISEARKFGIKEILPTFVEGDREGVQYIDGHVKAPECFHRPHKLFSEGEWITMIDDPDVGGQGLPFLIAAAASEYLIGANFSFTAFFTLAHGAGKMIELYGTEKQKKLFLKKLYTGQWAGTMVLTESGAGSDVGSLTTSAVRNSDGTYSITGNKIFITNGEHDLTENIIHPVLARIEGAPRGTKGISIFLVPRIWVNDDGTLGEPNDVVCTGIEKKMGLHGSPTCSLAFGSKGNCRGLLLGEENKGMKIMFHMMNEARLDVGAQGFLCASPAYLYALNYARERVQGRDLEQARDMDAPLVTIINHPDVRRMLLWMKAHVDGMRSFLFYVARCFDLEATAESEEKRDYYHGLIELLTPVVKAYCSDRGFDVCVQAIQIYGGYGYTREYPVEQLARDAKIASIYEGTNGIQAMDLLGRKLGMKNGQVYMDLVQEIQYTITAATDVEGISDLVAKTRDAVNRLGEVAIHMGKTAMSPEAKVAFSFAYPFLEVTGDVIMAWMHLWRAAAAAPKVTALMSGATDADERQRIIKKNKDAAFYDGQVKTARYFMNSILPVTVGKMNAIMNSSREVVEIDERSFGGI